MVFFFQFDVYLFLHPGQAVVEVNGRIQNTGTTGRRES